MRALSIDPGETTGWALWEDWELADAGQQDLWPFVDALFGATFKPSVELMSLPERQFADPELLIVEDWAVYPWIANAGGLDWDACRTARGIGAIELIARAGSTTIVLQPAQIKETAVAAGAEHLFLAPLRENRHANDAIMHGVYYRLVGEGKND